MIQLMINECEGFTKQQAFAKLPYDPNRLSVKGCNCTHSWKKEGSPIPGTLAFKRFVINQLREKTKNECGTGLYIVLKKPIPDNRKRPYTIVNYPVTEVRKWEKAYVIREDILDTSVIEDKLYNEYGDEEISVTKQIDVLEKGLVVDMCSSKAEALERAKDLNSETKKSYSIIGIKVPNVNLIAAHCIYTPSKGAEPGQWIAFGYSDDNMD